MVSKKKPESAPLVLVVWMNSKGGLTSLYFGDGTLRIYEKDRYDPRVDLNRDLSDGSSSIPFFTTYASALTWLSANVSCACQVTLTAARKLGFKDAHR